MKTIILSGLTILSLASIAATFFVWFYPVKHSLSSKDNIEQVANDGEIALLCRGGANTGPMWKAVQKFGIDKTNEFIDITGNTPDKLLKAPIYNYINNAFLFIGEFARDSEEVFLVEKWYTVGNIERGHLLLPYPKGYFNVFEIDLN